MQSQDHTPCLSDYFAGSSQFFYFIVDDKGQCSYANTALLHYAGLGEACGSLPALFSLPGEYQDIIAQCMREKRISTTLSLKLPGEVLKTVRWEFSVFLADAGHPGIQAIGMPDGDPGSSIESMGKKAGQMARRYKAYEQSPEGLWKFDSDPPVDITADPDQIIEHWRKYSYLAECNDNVARMYGYEKAEDLTGTPVSEFIDFSNTAHFGDFRAFIRNGFRSTLFETKEFDRYGNVKYFLNSMEGTVENGSLRTVWGTQQDITGQRLAEEGLQKSELFYRSLIAESQDGIVLTDENGTIYFATLSVKKVLGYDAEDVVGKNIFQFTHPEDQGKAREAFEKEMTFVKQPSFINIRLLNKAGAWIWCVVRGHNMISNPGVGRLVVYFYENTAEKKMLQALQDQAIALGNVFDLIITCDLHYNIQNWNKRAEQVIGFTEEEATGKFLGDLIRLDYDKYSSSQVAAILSETGNWQGEISFINRYGVRKTVLHTASYLLNERGERVSIIGTGIDITEKKTAEEQLQQSELFYRNLFVNSLDAVLITDPFGKIQFASPSVTSIFGYSPEEIKGKTTFDFAHPDDRQLADKAFAEELSGNPQRKFISVRIQNKKKDWVWCIVRGHNLLSNPYINGMVVYLYDDSLRKETEQALIQSESRFRTQATLLDNVTDVIVTIDMNRVVTSWNTVSEKLTGITAKEAVGRPYRDVIKTSYHPFTNEQVFGIVQSEGIWRGEISLTGFDGETRYLLHTISLLKDEQGGNSGMMGVGKDITERKRMEAQLQQSETFYRSLAANSLDGIILTDASAKIIYCGPSLLPVSGYRVEELLGKTVFDFVHPDDHDLAMDSFTKEVHKESVLNYAVLRLRHATRGWVWCTVRGHNLLHDPVLKGIVIYFADDTKRKLIEDRLRESESRFRNLIHNLKLGVILQNERSEMLVCNQAALDMLGITEEQLSGVASFDPRWNVIHEDGTDFPGTEHPVPVAIATRKPVRDVVMGVYRPLKNDRAWLLVNAEPVFDDDNNLINVICSFTDITEQRRFSQELIEQEIQKQKLITQATIDGQEKERQEIGKELHDNINQHLTTTRLYLEVAREKTSGEVQEMINLAHKNLAEIVHEIRQISQSLVPPTLGDIGLIESIQDLCDLLKRTHSFAVEFQHRHFREDAFPDNMKLMIFRIIQEQVSNIIRHAQAQTITIRLQSDAEHIHFSIEDDGQGFDPQQHKKGMGLNNIINRAALFDGSVEIRSAPGKGCFVTVNIPLPASHHG